MSKVLLSVCCLAFNHDNYIRKCLEGFVLQKTDFAFEVLIHDDASTDKTADIILEYEKKFPNIIKPIYQRENQFSKGVWVTRDFNYARAKGKYIAMCEGDDYWTDPLKLQKQVDFLENNEDFNGCFHKTRTINETEKRPKLVAFREYNKQIFTFEDTISKLVLFHTSAFVFRREKWVYNEHYKNIHSADMALFSTIAKSGKLFLIDEFMSVYRINGNGITRNVNLKRYHENRIILMDYLIKISEEKYFDSITKIKNYHISNLNVKQKNSKYNLFDHDHLHMKVIHKARHILSTLLRNKPQ